MPKSAFITVMIFALFFSALSVAMAVTDDALVGYWPFNEGSGNIAVDATGNGHDGELIDNPTWVQGKYGSALSFGAGSEYVVVPDDDALDLSDALTYMGWFNLREAIEGQRRMMSKNDSIFFLFDFSEPTSLDFLVKPNNDFAESTTMDWVLGEWYHFAGTYDGDALRMYINGVLEGETPGIAPIATSDLDLWIGADDYDLPTTTFPGSLDEIRIYNVALTESEIAEAMESTTAVSKDTNKLSVTWGMVKSVH
jgi:hypothetical protein